MVFEFIVLFVDSADFGQFDVSRDDFAVFAHVIGGGRSERAVGHRVTVGKRLQVVAFGAFDPFPNFFKIIKFFSIITR